MEKDLDQKKLQFWNQRGWFPSPQEDDLSFLKRIAFLQKESSFPSPNSREVPALRKVQKAYDIFPDWVPILWSNDSLPPWVGGATWTHSIAHFPHTTVKIQMKKNFITRSRYLFFYDRTDLLAHEYVHAARYALSPSRYEEILAYRLSSSLLQRIGGPLLSFPLFSRGICLLVFVHLFSSLFYTLHPTDKRAEFYKLSLFCTLIWIFGFWLYIFFLKTQLYLCHKKFSHLCGKEKAWPLIYRLSDREISSFSRASTVTIAKKLKQWEKKGLRGRVLALYS